MNLIVVSGIEGYLDESGMPQLNLEHVALGLGFTQEKNGAQYVRWERVDGHLKKLGFPTCGERPKYIPEPILYLLCMKAENEAAQAFQRKVAYEVLPAIRKHGLYAVDDLLNDPDLAIKAFQALKEERAKTKALESQIEQDKPEVLFADCVAASRTSILVFDLAKLLRQNGVDIGGNRLFDWLRINGYLIKRKGADWNMPTQKSMELGLFEIKETVVSHADGHTSINKTPKVTGKGQVYFLNKLVAEKAG